MPYESVYYLQNNTSLISELRYIFPSTDYLRFTEFPSQNNNIFIYIEISGPLKTQERVLNCFFYLTTLVNIRYFILCNMSLRNHYALLKDEKMQKGIVRRLCLI